MYHSGLDGHVLPGGDRRVIAAGRRARETRITHIRRYRERLYLGRKPVPAWFKHDN